MQIILATKNDSKIKEIKRILNSKIDFKTYKDFNDWPEVEETGKTFKENSLLKARALAQKYNKSAIADDSGLIVNVLNGKPGVYSSRYAGEKATDAQNIEKLLSELKDKSDRTAAFVTVVSYYAPSGAQIIAEGRVCGQIIKQKIGLGGFGYDPVFVPERHEKTFAQMSFEEKNKLSHRGKAFRQMKTLLRENSLT